MLMSKAEAQLEKQNAAFEQLHKDEDDILDKIQGLIKAKDDKFAMQDEMLLLHSGGGGGGESGIVETEVIHHLDDDLDDDIVVEDDMSGAASMSIMSSAPSRRNAAAASPSDDGWLVEPVRPRLARRRPPPCRAFSAAFLEARLKWP